jgi:hypothetical protein
MSARKEGCDVVYFHTSAPRQRLYIPKLSSTIAKTVGHFIGHLIGHFLLVKMGKN